MRQFPFPLQSVAAPQLFQLTSNTHRIQPFPSMRACSIQLIKRERETIEMIAMRAAQKHVTDAKRSVFTCLQLVTRVHVAAIISQLPYLYMICALCFQSSIKASASRTHLIRLMHSPPITRDANNAKVLYAV